MSNPMFRENIYENEQVYDYPMTITGTVVRTLVLLTIGLLSALYTWNLTMQGFLDRAHIFATCGAIVGFVAVLISCFKPNLSKPLSIVYAFAEGLCLGSVSAIYNSLYNGIVIQAVLATMLTLGVMLVLYSTRIIKVTETFIKTIMIATISIAIFYLIVFLASFFHIGFLSPFIGAYNNPIIIGIIVVVAAFNLILDFDRIERGAQRSLPAYFEWYFGMGLMVTLVWLYIEILRLLASRRR